MLCWSGLVRTPLIHFQIAGSSLLIIIIIIVILKWLATIWQTRFCFVLSVRSENSQICSKLRCGHVGALGGRDQLTLRWNKAVTSELCTCTGRAWCRTDRRMWKTWARNCVYGLKGDFAARWKFLRPSVQESGVQSLWLQPPARSRFNVRSPDFSWTDLWA